LVEAALEQAVHGQIPAGEVVTRHSLEEKIRRGLRILVAEDHPVNQLLIDKILSGLGQSTVIVPDGAKALDILSKESFDLVLMDVQMPVLDGLDATRRLRAGEAGELNRHVHVVALTAATTSEERQQALDSGVDDLLSKPYVTADILRVIRRLQDTLDLGSEFGVL
jgi:CheY-like chemotaxis protein